MISNWHKQDESRLKLSKKDASEIVCLCYMGIPQKEIAHAYDIHVSTVSRIKNKIRHSDIKADPCLKCKYKNGGKYDK